MAIDLTVYLPDRPGQVATVARHLADAGVNIDGYFGLVVGDQGIMHVLVDDEAAGEAAQTLRNAGYEVPSEREVLVLDCEDRPGTLAELLRPAAEAGLNLTLSYVATRTRMVVGAEDMDQLRSVLEVRR